MQQASLRPERRFVTRDVSGPPGGRSRIAVVILRASSAIRVAAVAQSWLQRAAGDRVCGSIEVPATPAKPYEW
ncbi:hypothetical protein NDU88_007759 [Pleurodeles waltl]|uniref:Uncharacterized protein n=1 Tax=Pleurodeles waltl TaxID=8319 RepID=A0AAV7PUF6_PLEWA|nr:hypothetical protein NDU88_007759 [Pleurodeles waltl]